MEIFNKIGNIVTEVGSIAEDIGKVTKGSLADILTGIGKICSGCVALVSQKPSFTEFAQVILTAAKLVFHETPVINVIGLVCAVVGAAAELLSIKKTGEDSPADLGMKAEQAEKGRDDFETDTAYIEYLHEIELDRERIQELTEEEKAPYSLMGTKLYADGIREQLGVTEISPMFLLECAKLGLRSEEFVAFVMAMSAQGLKKQEGFHEYLQKEDLSPERTEKVRDSLFKAMGELYPELSPEEIAKRIFEMKTKAQTD